MEKKTTRQFFILSPFLILLISQAAALFLGRYLDARVYLPIILIYWAALAFILYRYGFEHIGKWLQKPRGHWIWYGIAVLVAFSSLPLFLQHYQILGQLPILIPTVVFFLVNPWLEEFYWRGMLIDLTEKWPAWLSILYSTILFTAFHSAFTWYSPAARNLPFFGAVLFLGLVMALIYKYTKSVRLTVASQMVINFLNLSIPSLLNMIEF